MKYSGPNFSLLLVDGYNLVSTLVTSVSAADEALTEQTNPFGVTSEQNTPIGITKATLTVGQGLFDETVDALHNALASMGVGVARVLTAAFFGNTPGKPFHGYEGAYTQKYEVMDEKDGLTKANVQYLISGVADKGQIIQDLATFTATWSTATGGANAADTPVDYTADPSNRPIPITSNSIANPTVVTTSVPHGLTTGQVVLISGVSTSSPTINGSRTVTVTGANTFTVPVNVTVAGTGGQLVKASTVAGGVGYNQVSAYSGFTNVVQKIRHSPDDSTYADLITFATITARTATRQTVAGTVDRYLCSTGTVSGSGSITAFSGFCRY